MGFYDRDYYRDDQPGFQLRGPRTMVGWIILVNVVVFIADGLFTPTPSPNATTICNILACKSYTLVRPWLWWQFVTYGFTHTPFQISVMHILSNMLGLFFLGPAVEQRYGSREFLRLYLAMIVLGGVAWSALCMIQGDRAVTINGETFYPMMVGASGAVTGVVLLFAFNFPRQMLLLFFVIPVPAWLVGALLVATNLFGQAGYGDQHIAYSVHLSGLAFAGAYYYFGWNLGRVTGRLSFDWLKRRPKFRVHSPGRDEDDGPTDDRLAREVDRILQKIHDQGEASLSKQERRTLEAASRQYQKQRRDDR
ncbi:MAG TPA: rhomboid family intramembrane serine protease [Thermoguttaceae bacterium]|nr:rhomboid family intramembrane serine protease [Thermoguttaceae bacterium]